MTGTEDTLKIIGMAVIGIIGIVLVLAILSVLCAFLAVFAYVSMPGTPTVTISPIDNTANHSAIVSATAAAAGQASALIATIFHC